MLIQLNLPQILVNLQVSLAFLELDFLDSFDLSFFLVLLTWSWIIELFLAGGNSESIC